MENEYKQIINLILIEAILVFIPVILTLKQLTESIFLTLVFIIFFYVPWCFFIINMKNIEFLEKILWANMLGFVYGSIYLILDVILKFKLTNIIYLILTAIIILTGIFYLKKKMNKSKENIKIDQEKTNGGQQPSLD